MFPTSFFPAEYFAPQYWGGNVVGNGPTDVGLGIVESVQLYAPGAQVAQRYSPGAEAAQIGD